MEPIEITPVVKAQPAPHEYEDRLIDAVHKQALVLMLLVPDGYQRSAVRAYAEAARIDYTRDFEDEVEIAEAEVAMLAMQVAEQGKDRSGSRLTARVVVARYIDRTIKLTVTPPDVCAHCGHVIGRANVRRGAAEMGAPMSDLADE